MDLSQRSKRIGATVVLIAAFASAGVSLRAGGAREIASAVVVLYVGSLVFAGVWTDRLQTEPYTRGALFGLLGLLASLYGPTALLGPPLAAPGAFFVVRDLLEQRST